MGLRENNSGKQHISGAHAQFSGIFSSILVRKWQHKPFPVGKSLHATEKLVMITNEVQWRFCQAALAVLIEALSGLAAVRGLHHVIGDVGEPCARRFLSSPVLCNQSK